MSVLENTTTAADLLTTLDVEFAANFLHDLDKLQRILGIHSVETVSAGTAMFTKTVEGKLAESTPDEGDEVTLSKYSVKKNYIGEVKIKRYARLTTAEAIQKAGREDAISRTDAKMVKDLRSLVWDDYFKFLATGTGTAEGTGLQATIAKTRAALTKALEKANDSLSGEIVWFMNPDDTADYLAQAPITMQNVFGLNYLQSFLGVNNVFETTAVEAGTIIATPAENIHLYGVDFGTLSASGLSYETLDSGIIGVHHEPVYNRGSVETHVMLSANLLAETLDFIIKGTVNPFG